MPDIGIISYSTGALVFLILSLVLMTGERKRPFKFALMLASLASAIWMGVTAWSIARGDTPFFSYLLEPLRDLALLGFLTRVLSAAYTDPVESKKYFRRTFGMLSSFTLLLCMMLVLRLASGHPLLSASSMDMLLAGYLVMSVIGLVMVEQLIRNARRESRRSIKYLCIGLGAVFAFDFYLYSHALLFRGVDASLWNARGFINALVVPVIGIAAARAPDWSLDIFVSRRVVFHTAALLGSGVYLLTMGAGGYFIYKYGGTWGTIAQVIFMFGAVLMLAMLLFSGQLRAKFRVFLNKHFFHYKFEYRDEWLRFIATLTSGEPNEELRERAVKAIANILDCPGGVMWLYRESQQYELMASWQIDCPQGECVLASDSSLVDYLRNNEWVVNIDEYNRGIHAYDNMLLPDWFRNIDNAWLITPLIFHDRLYGLVVLTRPHVVPPLNWEDYDLLRIVGRQSAAHLAQLDSTLALSQAKQFEATNRLSAYVMHDLKNLIAQLSLVVSNAGKHKHNPQFMEDAITTVENSVNKMNRLLAHLHSGQNPARQDMELNICDVLQDVVKTMSSGAPPPSLDCQASGLLINADSDRFAAVVGHVIRNAQDATPDTGSIIVRLFKQGHLATVEVQDTGKGMDEDFIRTRLFKPFESTKGKSGMGIGAYETREYIRGLGGEIEVISRVDEGTTFRLRIPISNETKTRVKSADKPDNGKANDHEFKEIAGC